MAKTKKGDIGSEAIALIKREITSWSEETVFVTDKVAFNMRNVIKLLRKNYYGIFDEPYDPTTGRKKIWVPLTESLVESAVKNVDLDTKDINFRAKKPDAIGLTHIVRSYVKNCLDDISFGETLDKMIRDLARDGTAVWKTIKSVKDGKTQFQITPVDLLNFYIDPTAPSIQEADVIERAVMTLGEFQSMTGWDNKEGVEGSTNINRNERDLSSDSTETKFVEVYERWGFIPKSFITGKKQDAKELVQGHIVVSCSGNAWQWHLIEENKGPKPYEEFWYTRVNGRWHGRGVAEKIMGLQTYINLIVNIRANRAQVSQLGIFKIRQGSGITPQMVSRLASNGAITVNSQDDIEQFVMQEASQSSYNDEEVVKNWAQQVTSLFEPATGEALPSSTPATNAAIQNNSAQSQFVLIKEGIGLGLQRWIKRQVLPIMMKNIKAGDVIRLTGDVSFIREIDEMVANAYVYKAMSDSLNAGEPFDPASAELERQSMIEQLRGQGEERFTEATEKVLRGMDVSYYDVQVYVTNEEIDKGVLTQNLLTALQLAPQYQEQIMQEVFDVMGLNLKQPKQQMQQMIQAQGAPQGMAQSPSQNPQSLVTEANTLNG